MYMYMYVPPYPEHRHLCLKSPHQRHRCTCINAPLIVIVRLVLKPIIKHMHMYMYMYNVHACTCMYATTTVSYALTCVLCFAGQLSRKVKEWHLSLSLYKLIAFVTCSITELSTLRATAYLLFPLDKCLAKHSTNLPQQIHKSLWNITIMRQAVRQSRIKKHKSITSQTIKEAIFGIIVRDSCIYIL